MKTIHPEETVIEYKAHGRIFYLTPYELRYGAKREKREMRWMAFMYRDNDKYFAAFHSTSESVEGLQEAIRTIYHEAYGMLSPEGKFYVCNYSAHSEIAYFVKIRDVDKMLDMGWLHVTDYIWMRDMPLKKITQKQINFIADYCDRNNQPLPEFWDKVEERKV